MTHWPTAADAARLAFPPGCASLYNAAFPDRPPLGGTADWLVGTWCIGACYANPNKLYGAYPRGYLARVHSMFPDARSILHVFSGGLTLGVARAEANAIEPEAFNNCHRCGDLHHDELCVDIELVDLRGPEQGRYPTWQGDVLAMPAEWAGRFDLVLADPPYSAADAETYGTSMPKRGAVTQALRRVTRPGGVLVWLDVVWPMHRKAQWRTFGHVGLVRSTNHRMRLVSFFEAVGA